MNGNEIYLMFSDADANHNKFYQMINNGNGTFLARWGRVGTAGQDKTYPINEWHKKYDEKIKKGYKDISEYKATTTAATEKFEGDGSDLLNTLARFTRKNLILSYENLSNVSAGQIDMAYDYIQHYLTVYAVSLDIEKFNNTLIDLFTVLPRRMVNVSSFLAKDDDDYCALYDIINREMKLLDNMKALVSTSSNGVVKNADELKLEIREATDEEKQRVIDHCNYSLQGKVHKVWKVNNIETKAAFDKYVNKSGIKDFKMLWHGSGNENWLSILSTGLKIRPAGVHYTGSMFGDGLYFATDAGKSFNYTSYQGTYWRNGNSNVAYMAVFNTAIGKPYNIDVHSASLYKMNQKKIKKLGYDSLFAHKGKSLQRDEIVFYTPEAVTIEYLVEFK